MIVYRNLTSDEILAMINNTEYKDDSIKGENTFHYEEGCSYKHFFVFADHTQNYNKNSIIGEYVIPNDIIYEYGFGYYKGVKTMRNDKLYHRYMPLPEIIIKSKDFKKECLYSVNKELNPNHQIKKLGFDGNSKYNEPLENCFSVSPSINGYLDYSYADVYYEMVYQLAKENDMNLEKVAYILKNVNLHEEIKKYFENYNDFFRRQTKEYVKFKKIK